MSLKAKIEAVIYAAEEPVTLAQLAFLFGGEVLPAKEQSAMPESGGDPVGDSANPGIRSPLEGSAEDTDSAVSAQSDPPPDSTDAATQPEEPAVTASEGSTETPDEKKSARARDRAIREELRAIIASLIDEYSTSDRGMEIREIAGGYRVATKPEYHDAVRSFVKSLKPPMKLSLQALETLAVIAYKQPVTAPEVNEIRGVDSGGVLGSLMSRKLITTAGRKQVIGRPILYKTTKEFLLRFGLKDVNELPSIEEFEKMAGDMEIEDDLEPLQASGELPFDGEQVEDEDPADLEPHNAPPDPLESAAVEANAGEAGVSVGTPLDGLAQSEAEPAVPETIELDSSLATETSPPEHEAELITAPSFHDCRWRMMADDNGAVPGSDPQGLSEDEFPDPRVSPVVPSAIQAEPRHEERLQKIIASAGVTSRRKAEELITEGRVQVNGKTVTELGTKADAARDHIRVDGKLLKGEEKHRYFMLNKPKGFVTTVSDPEKRPTVMQFFKQSKARVFPVGRLDYQSEGLLLMTNDGDLANLLTKASSKVDKTYLVKVSRKPSENAISQLRAGIMIDRGRRDSQEGRVLTQPAGIRLIRDADNPWYEVTLTEGRNRQIRKLFEEVGHFVEKIRRVGYGPLVLDVAPGEIRELTSEEVLALQRAARGIPRTSAAKARTGSAAVRGAGVIKRSVIKQTIGPGRAPSSSRTPSGATRPARKPRRP